MGKGPLAVSAKIKKKVNSEPSSRVERAEGRTKRIRGETWMGETFGSDKDKETEAEVGKTEGKFEEKQMEERRDVGDRTRERPRQQDRVSGRDAEAGRGTSAVRTGGTRPCGMGMGRVMGPPSPPSPAAARASYQVTKLPQDSGASDWRGRSQSASGAAVLGQEAWKHAHLPTPRKPLTQARWRAPPLSRGHAEFPSTVVHTRRPSQAPTHVHAHSHTCKHMSMHSYT